MVQSGPGLHIPKGIDGPGNVLPTPSEPIRGSTYCQICPRQTIAVSSHNNMHRFRLIIIPDSSILGFCLSGFHIVCRLYAKLFLETFREVRRIGEAYHITDFTDGIFPFKQKLGGLLKTYDLYHLVGRDVGKRLDLCEETASADIQSICQEIHVQLTGSSGWVENFSISWRRSFNMLRIQASRYSKEKGFSI